MNIRLPSTNRNSEADTAAFRRIYFLFCALTLLYGVLTRFAFTAFAFAEGVVVPYGPFSVHDPYVHALLGALAGGLLVAVALGRGGAWAVGAALFFSLLYFREFTQLRSVGIFNRVGRENCLLLALLALHLVRPRGRRESDLFLYAIRFTVCFPYFSAGVYKLLNGGHDWWSGEALQAGLLSWSVSGVSPWSLWLAGQLPLLMVLSAVAIFVELLCPLAIVFEGIGPWLFLYALTFHLGVLFLMGPNFLESFLPAFVIFLLPWRPLRPLLGKLADSGARLGE